jgi:hypothetical protein
MDIWGPRKAPVWLFFDIKLEKEAKHARVIGAAGPASRIAVPNSGHPSGSALVEAGVLGEIVSRFLTGTEDAEEISALIAENISKSPTVLSNVAGKHKGTRRHAKTKRAFAVEPENAHAAFKHGLGLLRQRKIRKAEEVLRSALELKVRDRHLAKYAERYRRICEENKIPPALSGVFDAQVHEKE